ncbi:MAG: OprO/OprP family phosphate-selective porin [Pseudomonadota bacterium]|nr:OprO/OprP family phosphate-selective porin [Pseudomonadota bacterium]
MTPLTFRKTSLALSLLVVASASHAAATPTNDEIWALLQQVQQQLSEVKQQNQQLKVENETLKVKVDQTEQTANSAHEAVEAVAEATESAVKSVSASKTTIGGYGELHYNNLEDQNGSADKDEIDFHRFVLFFGHEFNDRLRLFSELELEHSIAGEGQKGEIELEQAYIQYDLNDQHRVSAGVFLTPVGIINETHEPNTFYGVERNNVEKNIIPTTWWEGGVMASGELPQGFSYDVAMTSGLETSSANQYAVRNGRQKVAQANAEDFAYTGRLKWTAIPGVELATSLNYQEDITQGIDPAAGSATMWETHAVINKGPFGLRALYATWDLDGTGPASLGADEQTGWYIEPSYQVNDKVGVFSRYSSWDNQAGSISDTEYTQWDIGMNWWLDPQVVVKFDYQDQSTPANEIELDGFNIGVGYQF